MTRYTLGPENKNKYSIRLKKKMIKRGSNRSF